MLELQDPAKSSPMAAPFGSLCRAGRLNLPPWPGLRHLALLLQVREGADDEHFVLQVYILQMNSTENDQRKTSNVFFFF